jgi:hypothetical protein
MPPKIKYFASGMTYCITQRKRTFNDGTGVTVHAMKNGTTMIKSVCKECGHKKSVITSDFVPM